MHFIWKQLPYSNAFVIWSRSKQAKTKTASKSMLYITKDDNATKPLIFNTENTFDQQIVDGSMDG